MKKYCLYIIFSVLLGCSAQDKSVEIEPVCRETGCFKWTDKKQAVKYYENNFLIMSSLSKQLR